MNIRIIKLLSIPILVLGVITNSMAIAPGPYVGLQLGVSQTKLKSNGGSTSNNNSLGGGFSVGGVANDYFAAEGFYTHFANGNTNNNPSCGSSVVHTDMLGFAGIGSVPIGKSGFKGFVKGGVGVVRSSGGGQCPSNRTTTSARPVVGIGASYELTQTFVADLSYTKLIMNSTVISSSLIALGITYHMVDVYCGQFLC